MGELTEMADDKENNMTRTSLYKICKGMISEIKSYDAVPASAEIARAISGHIFDHADRYDLNQFFLVSGQHVSFPHIGGGHVYGVQKVATP